MIYLINDKKENQLTGQSDVTERECARTRYHQITEMRQYPVWDKR